MCSRSADKLNVSKEPPSRNRDHEEKDDNPGLSLECKPGYVRKGSRFSSNPAFSVERPLYGPPSDEECHSDDFQQYQNDYDSGDNFHKHGRRSDDFRRYEYNQCNRDLPHDKPFVNKAPNFNRNDVNVFIENNGSVPHRLVCNIVIRKSNKYTMCLGNSVPQQYGS